MLGKDGALKIHFEPILEENIFKLTPVDFSPGSPLSLSLTYLFSSDKGSGVSLRMSTENNSVPLDGKTFHDGEIQNYRLNPGEVSVIAVTPEKYIQTQGKKGCRHQAYNDLVLKSISNLTAIKPNCPCRPTHIGFGKRLEKMLENLPYCKEENDNYNECFIKLLALHRNKVKKPCTKLQYKGFANTWKISKMATPNYQIVYTNPPIVMVNEEALVYDLVDVICSTGGALSLCVGFSFYSLLNAVLSCLDKMAIYWIKGPTRKNIKVSHQK